MRKLSDLHELSTMKINFTRTAVFTFRVDSFEKLETDRYINNLYLILDGSYRYTDSITGEVLEAGTHDIVLMPKGSSYKREFLGKESKSYGSGICIDFNMSDESGEEVLFPPKLILLANDHDGYYEKYYRELLSAQLDIHGNFAFRRKLYELFDRFFTNLDRFSSCDRRFKSIEPAIDLIEHFPQDNLSVEALSKRCNLSQSRLRQLFREYTGGLNPVEYRNNLRIAKAKELLSGTENYYSIESIAEMLGFYDASYFIKTFSKIAGMTPTEFRRK